MNHAQEQKNIAKNTIFLYVRMIVVMSVSLYTSRIVLDKLGINDYGIYNIAGSVVVSLAFVKSSLASAIRRFLSYSKGKSGDCSSMFSMGMNVQIVLMFILFVILETFGLYFFSYVLNIPQERKIAAVVVYHLSAITFCVNLIRVPYDALIVSNEKMSVYAYISILEVAMKMLVAFVLTISICDHLILYATLILLVDIVINLAVYYYCKRKMPNDCHYKFTWEKERFKEFFSFSFWNLVGGLASIGSKEGPNYFLNVFLGVRVNAAMGVAKQISNMVYHFSSNFQSAFNPQIVKSYAADDRKYLFSLIFRTSKLSFFLMYVMLIPILFCIDDILNVWLTMVPEYTQIFCACFLLSELIAAVSSPFWMAAHAIGNIKSYQLHLCIFSLSMVPVSWVILIMQWEPHWIFVYQIFMNLGVLVYRINYVRKKLLFPIISFYREVLLKIFIFIPILTLPLIYAISRALDGIPKIIITTCCSILIISISFIYIGLTNNERQWIFSYIRKKNNLQRK